MIITIHSDGGARGNPGPAAIGIVLEKTTGEILATISEYIGETTNNQAEYRALVRGLEKAKEFGATEVRCYLDSELVVKQMNHEYKIKDAELSALFVKAWNITRGIRVSYHHVARERNKIADRLVNQALDARRSS
jgi:ribonuclease HI